MADQQSPPDHGEDPRKQGTGQGYPETQPEDATPQEGTDSGPEAGAGGTRAPSTSGPKEDDRAASTGNPNAAG
jgi:hypothetical protein